MIFSVGNGNYRDILSLVMITKSIITIANRKFTKKNPSFSLSEPNYFLQSASGHPVLVRYYLLVSNNRGGLNETCRHYKGLYGYYIFDFFLGGDAF